MVLFFMVLLVLIACYAASQTSSLSETSRRLPIKNINQLIRTGANVGYQQGSFIKNLLIGKGLFESQLVAFNTSQNVYDLLSQGSVAGLTPHLQLRQAGHCKTLGLVPTFSLQAARFGFAFRTESTEVRGMSNGILKLIYNGQMRRIQERTIGSVEICQDDQNFGESSDFIDRDTLWILVAGTIGVLLLMIIMMMVQCRITFATTRKKKKALAYPCYALPNCNQFGCISLHANMFESTILCAALTCDLVCGSKTLEDTKVDGETIGFGAYLTLSTYKRHHSLHIICKFLICVSV